MIMIKELSKKIARFRNSWDRRAEERRLSKQIDDGTPPYNRCKNCNTELQGMYCHKCGQYAMEEKRKFKEFIVEYFNNTYPIDTSILPTLYNLIIRPGFLTKEFLSGKINSYVHPLKLNFIFLFVILTAVVFFSVNEEITNVYNTYTRDDSMVPVMIMSDIYADEGLHKQYIESPKIDITLLAPYTLIESFPEYIIPNRAAAVDTFKVSSEHTTILPLDTLHVRVPSLMLEKNYIIPQDNGMYIFTNDEETIKNIFVYSAIDMAGKRTLEFLGGYLPLLILLLCPFLALSIRLLHLKKNKPYIHYFIFSLHYTAFIEIYLLCLFGVRQLIGDFPQGTSTFNFIILSIYVAIATKRVFGNRYRSYSLLKAIAINLQLIVWVMLILIIVFLYFIISYIYVATVG